MYVKIDEIIYKQNRFDDFRVLFKVEIKDLKIDKPNLKVSVVSQLSRYIAPRIVHYEETIAVQMGQKVSDISQLSSLSKLLTKIYVISKCILLKETKNILIGSVINKIHEI